MPAFLRLGLHLLLLFALSLIPTAMRAQVEASLVALKSTFRIGTPTITVGLRLAHQPKWHTYWLQPGTGLPTEITWDLPPGWTAGPIRWPTPKRVYDTAGNLAGNGYEGLAYLPVDLTPPRDLAPGVPVTLRARAEWLMCKDVCVPGSAELALTLTPIARDAMMTMNVTDSAEGEGLLAAIEALPRPLPFAWSASATRLGIGGDTVRLALAPADAASPAAPLPADPWYFDADGAIDYARPQHPAPAVATPAGGLALDLALSQFANASATRLRGVLTFTNGTAYLIDAPLTTDAASPPVRHATLGAASTTATTASTRNGSPRSSAALPTLLALAFLGGLILNLMPCVFPVLGLKVMGFVQQAGQDRRKITAHGLVFTVGVLLSFWALAAALSALRAGGEQLGWGFQLQSPAFVFALAVVLLAFALNLSGVFEFGLGATAFGGSLQQKSGLVGSFFTGVLATIVATPCSAPFLAPALGAALTLPTGTSFALFTAIALGLSTPYLALAFFPATLRALPRPGAWMDTFKHAMAFPLYATVALLAWILAGQLESDRLLSALLALCGLAFALWLYGLATAPAARRRTPTLVAALLVGAGALAYGWPRTTAPSEIVWEPWSAERVAALRAEGRPIYVDFTARWCFTCQTNKKAVFAGPGSAEVLKTFRDRRVATLRADWTNRDPLIAAELARWGRAAVPFNLVYLPGEPEPRILPELLTPAIVLDALTP